MTYPFSTLPAMRDNASSRDRYLLEPLVYDDGTYRACLPAGFWSDGASVPRIFWSIFPPWGKYTRCALLHDYLYSLGASLWFNERRTPITRPLADAMLRRAMIHSRCGKREAWLFWCAVRVGGGNGFQKYSVEWKP